MKNYLIYEVWTTTPWSDGRKELVFSVSELVLKAFCDQENRKFKKKKWTAKQALIVWAKLSKNDVLLNDFLNNKDLEFRTREELFIEPVVPFS
jgi:hypothetical protein